MEVSALALCGVRRGGSRWGCRVCRSEPEDRKSELGTGEGGCSPLPVSPTPDGDTPTVHFMGRSRRRTVHGFPPAIAMTAPAPWGGGGGRRPGGVGLQIPERIFSNPKFPIKTPRPPRRPAKRGNIIGSLSHNAWTSEERVTTPVILLFCRIGTELMFFLSIRSMMSEMSVSASIAISGVLMMSRTRRFLIL